MGSSARWLAGLMALGVAAGCSGGHKSAATSASSSSSGRTFTHAPKGCGLVKPATIATYLPRANCDEGPKPVGTGGDTIQRSPIWTTINIAPGLVSGQISLQLTISADAPNMYQDGKDRELTAIPRISDKRAVGGLGDEAYIVYGIGRGESETEIVARWGNAELDLTFHAGVDAPGGNDTPIPPAKAEAAATAAARDAYAALS